MIILKTQDEIEVMAKASKLVAETLQALKREVRPGVATEELDRLAEEFIRARGGGSTIIPLALSPRRAGP